MKYVYIDESGDLGRGKGSSEAIIIAGIAVDDSRKLSKSIKKIWRAKPRFHYLGELHAHAVDHSTRYKVMNSIARLDCTIMYRLVKKDEVKNSDLHEVYYQEIAKLITGFKDAKVVIVDRRDTVKKRESIITRLGLQSEFKHVEFRKSHDVPGLQAADFVAWAIFADKANNDKRLVSLVRDRMK